MSDPAATAEARIAPVGVVVPVRDYEAFVGEALESVLAQRPRPAQIVVVDDGSSDRSAEVAAGFEGVEVLRRSAEGVMAAVRSGVERISEPLLAFIDADDRWPPGSLRSRLMALEGLPSTPVVFGGVRQFHSPELSPEERARLPLPPQRSGLLRGTMLIAADAYRSVSQPDDRELGSGEFIDWWARAEELGILAERIEPVVLERRIHRGHIGRARSADRSYARIVHAALQRRRGAAR